MRVTGGSLKGKRLKLPQGSSARPTSALVRGAIFSILEPYGLEGSRVLDLYAGSGALGIEALSRGAAWADFVERDRRQCIVIKENLAEAGLMERTKVYCMPVEKALPILQGPYDFILMDPPYTLTSLAPVFQALASGPLLSPRALVVVEHSKRTSLEGVPKDWTLVRSRQYGETVVEFFRRGAA